MATLFSRDKEKLPSADPFAAPAATPARGSTPAAAPTGPEPTIRDVVTRRLVTAEFQPIVRLDTTEPVAFHPELVRLTTAAATELAPGAPVLSSGALHDAAAAAAGIPTVMLFVRSIGGVSHTSVEDTSDEDLALAVRALDGLTARTLEWLAA